MFSEHIMTTLKDFPAARDKMVEVLTSSHELEQLTKDMRDFALNPDREAEYHMINKINAADRAMLLSVDQRHALYTFVHMSAELFGSLDNESKKLLTWNLAHSYSTRLFKSFTLKK